VPRAGNLLGVTPPPFVLPTRRALLWDLLGGLVRGRAVRELADATGLDGAGARAAVLHALASDGSPWCGPVDEAIAAAVDAEVLYPARAGARALFDAIAPAVRSAAAALAAAGFTVQPLPEQRTK
jgi:hypothetical protein